jgi:hypothetical protein
MTDGSWQDDRWFVVNQIPTHFDINSCVNSDGSIKHQLISTQFKDVITIAGATIANKSDIKAFTTLNDAENHLLTAGFPVTTGNEFYSIRKIYF